MKKHKVPCYDAVVRPLVLAVFLSIAVAGLLLPFLAAAAFWNPFTGVPEQFSLFDAVQQLLRELLARIEDLAGGIVSKFRLPDPAFPGARADRSYTPPSFAPGARPGNTGVRTDIVTPSPRPGDSASHRDAFWADDCSCVKSTGAKPGITYEVSNHCPEDESRTCEDCRKITRHDNLIKTVAECREHGFTD